jgi:ubiquinone/menaquinone biosynthesis C-methylase UbiE
MATASLVRQKNNEAERPRQDFNTFAEEYAHHRKIDPPVLQDLLETGKVDEDSTILEVGCGTGNYIIEIASRTHATCYGLDPAELMLAQAKANPRANGIQWQSGYARHLEFPDEMFDLVYTVDVSHHIQHRLTYFEEVMRVLKPGGKVCTVTDSEWIISHREPLATYFPETIAVNLARYPTVAELLACKREAGFIHILEKMAEHPYMLYNAEGYREKAYSSLHLIDEPAFQRGLARLEADLTAGAMLCHSFYLLIWGEKPKREE